ARPNPPRRPRHGGRRPGRASPRPRATGHATGDRHRHHGRCVLPARRRPREHPLPRHPRPFGHGGGHGRLRSQQPTPRRRPRRHDLLAGGRLRGCGARGGAVPRPAGQRPRARGHLHQPDAGRDHRRRRHRLHGRPERQTRVHRRAGLGHRGDGLPLDRRRRPRPRQGLPRPRATVAGGEHQRHQGRQARRLLLRVRRADQRHHRPRRQPRHHAAPGGPRRVHGQDRREVRAGLLPGGDPGRHLPRPDHRQQADVGRQHPRRVGHHAERAGDAHPRGHLARPRRLGPGPRRSARLHARPAEDGRRRRPLAPSRGSVLEDPGRAACL
ncbi:MAG: TRAP transporter solute receptor, TAXI family precursor, partial [uncultured Acetobacteraceae bacterium]